MKLNYRTLGSGTPMVIMHGVFGTSDNWVTVSKSLAEHFHVYLLDLRNHGQSPHSEVFSYEAMAADLEEFIEEHKLVKPIIVGHSMGGKVAMTFAAKYENISKLIVVDIAPKFYPRHHDEILKGLNAIPLEQIQSRMQADEILAAYISELGVRQFLLKNLYRTEDGNFAWRLNLPIIVKNIDIIGEPLDMEARVLIPTLFVKGSKSNYILPSDEEMILHIFPNSAIAIVEDAGHWLQAEQPKRFVDEIMNFLK